MLIEAEPINMSSQHMPRGITYPTCAIWSTVCHVCIFVTATDGRVDQKKGFCRYKKQKEIVGKKIRTTLYL